MSKNEGAVLAVVVATGISSVVTQLLTIREFLAQFQGNEFVIALIFFNWLILGGIGTLLSRVITKRSFGGTWRPTVNRLAWLSLILAALTPLQILAIRFFKNFFFTHGVSVGFYPTLAYSFSLIMPYGLLLGFVLPYSLYVIRNETPDYPGARLYITDNLGDVVGGALFSFVLVFLLSPLKAVFAANLPLLIAAWRLFPARQRLQPGVICGLGFTLVLLAAGIYWERASLKPQTGKSAYYNESRYGRITVHQDHEQFTLFVDGSPLFSNQNIVRAEEAIHYPMAQLSANARPQRILLISAQAGMLTQLQKYHPQQADYVELDPEVARIQFHYGLLQKIPGLNIIHQDGRAYLSQQAHSRSGHKPLYDAIIINLPEPETFQMNRFFTDRFFQLAKRHLAPDGIVSFSMSGFDNYLAEPQRQKISSLYNTAAAYFKHILLLPGQEIIFLCRNQPLNTDIPELLEQKGITTEYIRSYYYGNLTTDRIQYLNGLIDPDTPVNRDLSPYLMRLMFSQWFAKFGTSPVSFIIALAVLLTFYLMRISKEEFVLFTTGAMTMGSEILVIFAFQIFFGYIYFQIGIIVTLFLSGLLPGAWIGDRLKRQGQFVLVLTDILLILFLGIFIVAVLFGGDRLPPAAFLGFGFMTALVCGCQFPAALCLRGDDNPAASRAFSADLLGAAMGALCVSAVLIPYLGLVWTTVVLISIKIVSLTVIGSKSWIK
ncbi:hypothetical protein QUF90_09600 [Desulfococcaceae bacterium HSG9]|nr:hypothetical protein [Desulfococcaceae bacterium HSG9]